MFVRPELTNFNFAADRFAPSQPRITIAPAELVVRFKLQKCPAYGFGRYLRAAIIRPVVSPN